MKPGDGWRVDDRRVFHFIEDGEPICFYWPEIPGKTRSRICKGCIACFVFQMGQFAKGLEWDPIENRWGPAPWRAKK